MREIAFLVFISTTTTLDIESSYALAVVSVLAAIALAFDLFLILTRKYRPKTVPHVPKTIYRQRKR